MADEIADAFSGTLQFGTAGLRGKLGPGPNRMNRVVVSRAAAGLAQYLLDQGQAGTPVVIGFDARYNSDVFARDTAEIFAGAGFRAMICPRPLPTPVLAGAILTYGASAGVVVTASHNPPQDNGYKVYLGDGSQIVPPADAGIAACIEAVGALADIPRSDEYATLDEGVVDSYLARVCGLALPGGARDISVAYTAMHGVGSPLMRAALTGAGFPAPLAVVAQDEPDPDFPTVSFPNPEEPGAMDLAMDLAGGAHVDLVLANDPDADRCAVGIPLADGGFRMLTGDEVGALLGWWILQRGVRAGHAGHRDVRELDRQLAAARGDRPRRRPGLPRDPHRLQVDLAGRRRPRVRLRGGAGLLRRPDGRARQGRDLGRAAGHRDGGGPEGRGPRRAGRPRRPRHGTRRARDQPGLVAVHRPVGDPRPDGLAARAAAHRVRRAGRRPRRSTSRRARPTCRPRTG